MKYKLLSLIALFIFATNITIFGQNKSLPVDLSAYISKDKSLTACNSQPGSNFYLMNSYTDKISGVTYYYVGQEINGIPVQNAQTTFFSDKNGNIKHSAVRFLNLSQFSANAQNKLLDAQASVQKVAEYFHISTLELRNTPDEKNGFSLPALGRSKIKPQLTYMVRDHELVLSYAMDVMPVTDHSMWQVFVDANSGQIIGKTSLTTACSFYPGYLHSDQWDCQEESTVTTSAIPQPGVLSTASVENAKYRVLDLPKEAPSFGSFDLIVNPADTIASPFGWHDNDGLPGVDSTNLNGANVFAYNDGNGDYAPDSGVDGGPGLVFDKTVDFNAEPEVSKDAAAINLFYMVNKMHDFSFHFGLDEAAGNFQKINYTGQGIGNDNVLALSQFSNGTTNTNNADFSTPNDGDNGVMRMFLWTNSTEKLYVLLPASAANSYEIGTAAFGPSVSSSPVTGEMVYLKDLNDPSSHTGCNEAENGASFTGKIVLIDRGSCDFSQKVYTAQQYGAIGVVIVNYENNIISMGAGQNASSVTIPSAFVTKSTGDALKALLENGDSLVVKLEKPASSGPEFLDASLDNGIIAHEYGHGISNRLTGGPNNSSCLNNDEQMGEGWSDFFSLVTTKRPGDKGTDARGIGTYALNETPTGRGIRTYPYSTDFTVNPHTMDDIVGSSGPHYLGEIWATTLWDLYWKMIEVYGDDGNLYGGTGGNSKAVQLVMQGMKLQPCGPGMLDGRDAILDADSLLNGGANTCLIWDVFARRGMGYFAKQNDPNNRNDNISDFTSYPYCQNKIIISKQMSKEVDPSGTIDVNISITNFKAEKALNVKVTDLVPEHTTYVNGSGGTINNDVVSFDLAELESGASSSFSYQVKVDDDYKSYLLATDPMEEDDVDNYVSTAETGNNFFNFQAGVGPNGQNVYSIIGEGGEYRSSLYLEKGIQIQGSAPALVVNHSYNTQAQVDGGSVFLTTDGLSYKPLKDEFYRGGPFEKIAYASNPIPGLFGFSGNSGGYVNSFFDVSDILNQNVKLRFSYAASDGAGVDGGGWSINRVDLVEPEFVNSEVCVIADNADQECASAPERGTWVKYNNLVKNKALSQDFGATAYPNPGTDNLNLSWNLPQPENTMITILNNQGQQLIQMNQDGHPGTNSMYLNVSNIPAGVYFIKFANNQRIQVIKYIKL